MTRCTFIRSFIAQFLLCLPVLCGAQTHNAGCALSIVVEPVYAGNPLVLTDQYYINGHSDTLFIDLFRFYITAFRLEGNIAATDTNSHLIDAEQKNSCVFHINDLSPGTYTSLQFIAGVDSIANTSGANGGDLDPAKGMYWAWNTGYIMGKMEGRSNVCKTLHHAFEFHIGGYMPPYNAARNVRLSLPAPIVLSPGKHITLHIRADAAAWFKNIDLATINTIVIPGKQASAMADNYAQMFSAATIKEE